MPSVSSQLHHSLTTSNPLKDQRFVSDIHAVKETCVQKTIYNACKECVPAERDMERTARDRSVVNLPFLVANYFLH